MNRSLLIHGDCLPVMHKLREKFEEKVKLVYADPPYNSQDKRLAYNDRRSTEEWIDFMRQRLAVARDLLAKDGFIMVHIDNKMSAYLKVTMDEVFGQNNYRNSIIVRKGNGSIGGYTRRTKQISKLKNTYETIHFFSKSAASKLKKEEIKIKNPIVTKHTAKWEAIHAGVNNTRFIGPKYHYSLFGSPIKKWGISKERAHKAIENYKIFEEFIASKVGIEKGKYLTAKEADMYYESYIKDHDIEDPYDFQIVREAGESAKNEAQIFRPRKRTVLTTDNWLEYISADNSLDKSIFPSQKSKKVMKKILNWLTKEGDLVLDFFSGSGTTASCAIELGRRFIAIEAMKETYDLSVKRIKEALSKHPYKYDVDFLEATINERTN